MRKRRDKGERRKRKREEEKEVAVASSFGFPTILRVREGFSSLKNIYLKRFVTKTLFQQLSFF